MPSLVYFGEIMPLSRRSLLFSASAAALVPMMARADAGAPALNALFDAFVKAQFQRSPELVTSLGLDHGEWASAKSRLSDASLAQVARDKADTLDRIARMKALDQTGFSAADKVNYATVLYTLAVEAEADRAFDYGGTGSGAPYILSQLTGAYQSVPDFLDSQHTIEAKADAEAYLARLEAFGAVMDQEIEQVRHDAGLGVVPPDFVIDKALVQMAALHDSPADKAVLVQSLVRRAREKGLGGDWAARAGKIYTDRVVPALDRQIALMKDLRARAVHDAGVARLPKGEAYYAASLKSWTTSDISPAEVHRTGLDMVAALSGRIDALLKAQGLTQGGVGERLHALFKDPKYIYPNTDAGKDQMIAALNVKVRAVQARLPGYFRTLPKAAVEIRRVPAYIEAGAPGGYYQAGALDGSRPGVYFLNLRDTAEIPMWIATTTTFHESIPGHHLQLTLQQEAGLPLIRKVIGFSGYEEGWALYAEQLADEMGMYDDDPIGRIGYLHDATLRAVRLVIDSGLHAMGWSREQGVKYYVDVLGDPEPVAVTEVERYCVWPGQACSYMVGKLTWLKLRDRAKASLGARYDIRDFHDAGLLPGAMPLEVLDEIIARYEQARIA
jgi:uncharacterized protein (DUF885 family)